jgi:hypothetical protein
VSLRFRVSGSRFWVLGSGFWVLGTGFWVLGYRLHSFNKKNYRFVIPAQAGISLTIKVDGVGASIRFAPDHTYAGMTTLTLFIQTTTAPERRASRQTRQITAGAATS